MAYIGAQPDDTPSHSHGGLTVEVIDDASVKLPDSTNIQDDSDYKDYFWSQDKLVYQWGTNGHIEVVYE
jgi:hypothetical protein